jgi:hypothetical protein
MPNAERRMMPNTCHDLLASSISIQRSVSFFLFVENHEEPAFLLLSAEGISYLVVWEGQEPTTGELELVRLLHQLHLQ